MASATRVGTEPVAAASAGPKAIPFRSPDTARTNNFDLVRLAGALQVAFVHATTYLHADALYPIVAVLAYFPGVPIFFAVSGFLVSLSLERASSLRQYARNRALRIFPALWVCIAVSLLIVLWYGVRLPSVSSLLVWLGAQLTVVQFYNPQWLRGFGVGALNGSLWSIPVELQFYIVLPLLGVWAKTFTSRWFLLAFLAGVLMLTLRALSPPTLSFGWKLVSLTIGTWLFNFLVGVILRHVFTAFPGAFRGRALMFGLVYLIWVVIEREFAIPYATGNELNVVSILLLSSLAISVAFTRPGLSSRILGTTDISYGLYIYHMPFVNLFLAMGLTGSQGALGVLAIAASLATLSWLLIERPALSIKHYTLKRR